MKNILTLLILLVSSSLLFAQEEATPKKKYVYVDGSAQIGADFVGSLAYGHSWGIGKKRNFILGTGLRFSGFTSGSKEFYSAPPEYFGNASTQDTVTINSPSQMNLALYFSVSYLYKGKFEIGMNIDVVGYTFGPDHDAVYTGDGIDQNTTVSSNNVSALLIGANDIGMLKSEFYAQYHFNKKWSARLGFASTFTEYSTPTELQEGNKRYRGISNGLIVGARYNLK
ncbi:hypothetical protein [Flammeovirga kamogawensis]|uniref:Outer membrane protein beta-barrel domain-containing protein n=1 Tax=Flammeovirga kamogawensis TaxID=373891 RepID=A0ABX8GZR7_9BACT|nr:hypothetical protein [Flammeovirga kamogawensis]MBB6459283.1 hypothetical protein [Flammeovirga kamogawensis]QWG08843.1 hypothetical protein KM029_07850 [Flammeovirga kamogawensis]TRX67133.1 hypothetical protein EO216_02895 [Flammeovirga kamogawensis]